MNDDTPLEEAYSELRTRLSSYAAAFRLSREDADDALHDSYLRLYASDDMSRSETRSRLIVTLKNNLIDRFRRRNRLRFENIDIVTDIGSVSLPEAEDRLAKADLLSSLKQILSPLQFEIIRLRACEELEYDEIALRMGMTEMAVRTNICRARKTIKKKILE